ncbi:MAG: TMEM165/GDT1 family protein [Sutterella wadsworthensis]
MAALDARPRQARRRGDGRGPHEALRRSSAPPSCSSSSPKWATRPSSPPCALAAKFPAEALRVISGTTLGMMIADAPAVFIGNKLAERLSMKLMRRIAAAVFAILAVAAWLGC